MLKKFIAVKNVGRFINSGYSGVQECLKTTLVLGGNGFGKTTLGVDLAIERHERPGDHHWSRSTGRDGSAGRGASVGEWQGDVQEWLVERRRIRISGFRRRVYR